jgi:hypothetical protein
MHEVYLVGCLDQLKNNEFALLVFVSIWKLGHPNFHKGYHPINFLIHVWFWRHKQKCKGNGYFERTQQSHISKRKKKERHAYIYLLEDL